jgi:hypothetical protein
LTPADIDTIAVYLCARALAKLNLARLYALKGVPQLTPAQLEERVAADEANLEQARRPHIARNGLEHMRAKACRAPRNSPLKPAWEHPQTSTVILKGARGAPLNQPARIARTLFSE